MVCIPVFNGFLFIFREVLMWFRVRLILFCAGILSKVLCFVSPKVFSVNEIVLHGIEKVVAVNIFQREESDEVVLGEKGNGKQMQNY